jgi:hypothetical protein
MAQVNQVVDDRIGRRFDLRINVVLGQHEAFTGDLARVGHTHRQHVAAER